MLSRGEVNRSLRSFIVVRGLWGAWGQMVGTNTAVFAGFVLSLGMDASDIAFYSAIASILAPVQIISSLFSKSIENKKRWVVWNGVLEALFRGLMITIPFLFVESLHQRMLLIFLVAGLTAGYIYTPFYSSWGRRHRPGEHPRPLHEPPDHRQQPRGRGGGRHDGPLRGLVSG